MTGETHTKKIPTPHINFRLDKPRLDIIALRIILEKDDKLWNNFILKQYPQLATIKKIKPYILNKTFTREVKKIYNNRQNQLVDAQYKFSKWWFPIEKRWFSFLKEIFELNNITANNVFTAYIGISPIFPRDIENETFLLPFYINRKKLLRLCAHETSHFFFYRKIKEINFAVQPDERHLWLISELLVSLLFSDPRSIGILGQMSQSSYICKQSLIERCREIYQRRLGREITIQELLEHLLQVEIKRGEVNEKFLKW